MSWNDLKKNIGWVTSGVSVLIGLSSFTGGYFAFKGAVETSQGYTIQRVEKLEKKYYKLDDKLNKVDKKASEVYSYKTESEKDRKQVMEQDMPYLKATLDAINGNLVNVLEAQKEIQKEQQQQQIYLQKIFRDNPELNVPDE